ncbi:MAG TPA: gephyrin-like molybdotransferase Glp [Abditibacteriaceae bacterium]|jgi:molybdopterin molybdotransferase
MQTLVTPDQARRIVLDNVELLPPETIVHAQVLGRILAQEIISNVELPPFDNSAMDGYAVRADDMQNAGENTPIKLRVVETIAAGNFPQKEISSGLCARIMTGAPLPVGADAVVMREDTRESQSEVEILTSVPRGTNIRRAGSDVARGETVLRAGTLIRAAEWGMLASLDQENITVSQRPRVVILTTGDELVPIGQPLEPGQIRDSNSFTLSALAQNCGALVQTRHIGDDPHQLEAAVNDAVTKADAVITSGGVSAGDFDPVRDVLRDKAQVHFWKIAMKPGKPVMFASWPGEKSMPVFGLPGNPVSVMVAFEQFVRPALLKMQGRSALHRPIVCAKLSGSLRSPEGKTEFVRALVLPDGEGWTAHLTGDQGSGRLSTMTRANALLVVPEGTTQLQAGQMLPAQMTDWPEVETNLEF